MPSPFPGMDPYLETPETWPDFHSRFINVISERLVPQVRPRYSVRIEERVYLDSETEGGEELVRPDLTISKRAEEPTFAAARQAAKAVPVQVAVPDPEEIREVYLVLRRLDLDRVVTVIELLSPANKRPSSVGREAYLEKRSAVLKSPTNLVELDLLRGGKRSPMKGKLPPGDYFAMVSRSEKRPQCDVYPCSLRLPLLEIPIPLAQGDADALLDLQAVLNAVYERAGYDYSINYAKNLDPSLSLDDSQWARSLLKARKL